MKEFLREYKVHITIGIFLFLFLPMSFFLWRYLQGLITEDIDSMQQLQVEREIQKSAIVTMPQLREQVDLINTKKNQLDVLLEKKDDSTIALYAEIEKISAILGHESIDIKVETYKKPAEQKVAKKSAKKSAKKDQKTAKKKETALTPVVDDFLYLHIITISTYNGAIAFLEKLDNLPYFSDVLSFDILAYNAPHEADHNAQAADAGTDQNLVEAHFYVAFYHNNATETSDQKKEDDQKS